MTMTLDSPALKRDAEVCLAREIEELGDWFHNIDLGGVQTAPTHFLGDFPRHKWEKICLGFPDDLSGASVLDVGCNAGFYSIELKKRNAGRVLAVDVDDRYLAQGRFAARTLKLDIEFEKRSVYDIDSIAGQFEYVLFMGIFYHLRYPLLALDKAVKKVAGTLVFQTMVRGSDNLYPVNPDYDFSEDEIFSDLDFPATYFIERSYSHDYTNWFIPNRSAAEGMLRSSGLKIVSHPEPETWMCVPLNAQRNGRYLLDMELDGTI